MRKIFEGLDRGSLQLAIVVGLWLRVLPFLVWGWNRCVRDECSYKNLGKAIARGNGMGPVEDWLWAPGYPYTLAGVHSLTGNVHDIKGVQVGLSALVIWCLYRIGARLYDTRTGLMLAWIFALHPTMAFFAGTLWSESLYTVLLIGGVLGALWARDGRWWRALLPGALVGVCVLFRGVATYMAPIFALALLWPAVTEGWLEGAKRRWGHAVAVLVAVGALVAPWSMYATDQFGGFVLSDATAGRMMYLGNNDYPPITFDYGNGAIAGHVYSTQLKRGRKACKASKRRVTEIDACERENGVAWIKDNPAEFVRRMPVRVAQLLNPNSFLTRNIRTQKWDLPWQLKELLCVWTALASMLVLVGGTLGAWSRARGPYALLAVGIVGYHVAAISLLAGLTRYRVPLEPLWMVFLAAFLVDPRGALKTLWEDDLRRTGALLTLPPLLILLVWYLPAGFPWWN